MPDPLLVVGLSFLGSGAIVGAVRARRRLGGERTGRDIPQPLRWLLLEEVVGGTVDTVRFLINVAFLVVVLGVAVGGALTVVHMLARSTASAWTVGGPLAVASVVGSIVLWLRITPTRVAGAWRWLRTEANVLDVALLVIFGVPAAVIVFVALMLFWGVEWPRAWAWWASVLSR